MRWRVRGLLRRAGVSDDVRTHSLRHTFATAFVQNGGKINALMRALGHASLETTRRYIDHVDLAEVLAAMPVTWPGDENR